MNRRERAELSERAVGMLALPSEASHRDACNRVCELFGQLLGADVEIRYIPEHEVRCSGVMARQDDGTYVIHCVKSGSWYHRLGVLLHELSHLLLGHHTVDVTTTEGMRKFTRALPSDVIQTMAQRGQLTDPEEKTAEALGDAILQQLTDRLTQATEPHPDPGSQAGFVANMFRPPPDRIKP